MIQTGSPNGPRIIVKSLNIKGILFGSPPWIARSLSQMPELRKRTYGKIFNSSSQTLAFNTPRHGSSPALCVYGRTQPGTFLASGLFTGESTRKPPAPARLRFRLIFMGLRNQRLGKGGSRLESTESTQRNPGTAEATPGSHLRLGAQKALIQRQKTV